MADDIININIEKQPEEQIEASNIDQTEKKEQNNVKKVMINEKELENIKEKEVIIDLWETIIQGNLDIVFSYDGIIDYQSFGPQGFAIVHYAATQGLLEGLKLLKQRGANLDLLTQSKQNALAIACNYGYLDTIKYLIDQGCSLDNTNLSNMSPLTYAIKNKKYSLIFYILTKIQFKNLSDCYGCSFVHYSASENDVQMLQFYNAFQLEYNLFDKQGQTPLTKAINNCALESIKFLLRINPSLIQYAIDLDVANSNEKIKQLIKSATLQVKLQQNQSFQKVIGIIKIYQKYLIIATLILFIFFELILFIISDVQNTMNNGFLSLIFDISFIIGMLYLIFYVVWFMLKTTDNQNQGTKLIKKKFSELNNQSRDTEQINVTIEPQESQQKKKQSQQKSYENTQNIQSDLYLPLTTIPTNNSQLQDEEQGEELEEFINIQEEQGELNEKEKFIKKFQKESQTKFNLYQIQLTPSFLEGVTLKDFLQLNYKPVEDLIDQMHTKPTNYFKFASKINQFKQEISSLLEINDPLWYNSFTIIHLVYFLFETNRFKLLYRIDWNRICFTCLQYKLPRTYHCSSCNMCVKDYHFHSNFLGKCINSTNHFFYFIFILSFTIMIDFYLLFAFLHYYDQINSILILIPNIFFLIDQYSRCQSILFLINLALSLVLNFELLVEITCILNNMTRNELFNSDRYKYLYVPSVLFSGQTQMKFLKRFQSGISINLFNFIKNSFRNLKIL